MFRDKMTIMHYCQIAGWSPRILILALFVSVATPGARGQGEPPRFYAKFSDGTYLDREEIHGWHDANATPRIGRQPLFAAENPVEWIIRDRLEPPRAPKAFVEFVGGDRLPGVVRGYVAADGALLRDLPRHLVVEPIAAYRRPNSERTLPIRVELAHVRRIVWRNRSGHGPAPPASAIRRDGSRLNFRAVRWAEDALVFLTESEIVTVPFHDLAEVSLPARDSWDAYFDHVATLLPGGEGRLIQMETDSGLIALVSTQRLRSETQGDNRYTRHWYQIIQPAWSLDPLWIRFPDIRLWRTFPPERVPLSLITPRIARDAPIFSDGIIPRTNRTNSGENLADVATQFGWGFATHAPSELIFPLSPKVVGFESHFGLDPMVGERGCAEALIEVRSEENTSVLFASETLIGSDAARSTGRLEIPKHSGGTLHLIADPRIGDRPSGADPFDIRDALNWYAPTLILDELAVRDEIRARSLSRLAPLADWEQFGESMGAARVATAWSTRDWDQPRFRSWVVVEQGCLGLRRELAVSEDARYLAVLAHAPESASDSPVRIQARVDGTPIAELTVPVITGRREVDPLLFPIGRFAGDRVKIELFQTATNDPGEEPAGVEWVGISIVSGRPGLRNLLEELPAEFALNSGDSDLNVNSPGVSAARLPGWTFPIAEEPRPGEYRYIQWEWSRASEGSIALALGHDGAIGVDPEQYIPPPRIREQPSRGDDRGARNGYRYISGTPDSDNAAISPAIALDTAPAGDSQRIQRDLYSDFGPFTLTGLGLQTNGAPLTLSGLWLARSTDAFEFIPLEVEGPPRPQNGKPPVLLESGDPLAFGPLLERVAPGFTWWAGSGQLALLESYAKRADVLRTRTTGVNNATACEFTRVFKVPAGSAHLRGAVSASETLKTEAALRVLVNGERLHEQKLEFSESEKWLEFSIDLKEHAGEIICLQLSVHAPDQSEIELYWNDIRVE